MRAPFDRFTDIYYGPATTTPGALKYSELSSRVVPDPAFIDREAPNSKSLAYLTTADLTPTGPKVVQTGALIYRFDYGFSDQVALTHGGPITHVVLRAENRTWPTGLPYWRAHIAPLLDVLPSVCSGAYHERYRLDNGIGLIVDFDRIGPTTWVNGAWTLTAEDGGPPDVFCGSWWKAENATDYWRGFTAGVSGWTAFSPTGFPLAVTMSPL